MWSHLKGVNIFFQEFSGLLHPMVDFIISLFLFRLGCLSWTLQEENYKLWRNACHVIPPLDPASRDIPMKAVIEAAEKRKGKLNEELAGIKSDILNYK